tara:strand:+ start:567 stop:773 length:207 start_codon:yes stop_codon:yes gene_type:complete
MTTIQTKYGAMHLYETIEELETFSYVDCVNWLEFNDSNGCYSIEDQVAEFGEFMPIWEMKKLILDQCN